MPRVPMHLILGVLVGIATSASSAEWKTIFNGTDLTGWSGDPRLWRVENGVIIGETNDSDKKAAANTFLIWQGGEPADFTLEFKARVTGDNNSGVQYRSKVADAARWAVGGYQMDLHPNQPYLGMLYEERGRGIACQRGQKVELGDKPKETGKLGLPRVNLADWNTYRIEARGHVLKHFVNDRLAAEIHDVHPEKRSAGGSIALQLHAGPAMKAEFRDLRISGDTVPPNKTGASSGKGVEPIAWIWSGPNAGSRERVYFRRDFDFRGNAKSATLTITCDNYHHLFVNGADLGIGGDWPSPRSHDVKALLRPGRRNTIAVEGRNRGGSAGLAVRLECTMADGSRHFLSTDEAWLCSNEASPGWQTPGTAPAGWSRATRVGTMGDDPWGNVISSPAEVVGAVEDMSAVHRTLPGFKLERLYRVPSSEGSWVAMTTDGRGRLLCADQYGRIYRVTVSANPAEKPDVSPSGIALQGAHGLLWHKGVLWVTVNEGSDQSGVWRVTDTDNDGEPDKPELVFPLHGRGEHGPHALVAAPDGRSIYLIAGNHTDIPTFQSSLVTRTWAEDQLLPRRPDAGGHAQDRMAPGGWIARFGTDGKNLELVSAGYRNAYDMAFNEHGDAFTYDSDMEWDMGMPWYRPTRFCQIVPGSEFGWRNGTGKWPDYYEDAMPSLLDIGPGSPTGVLSGKGAKFPAKYQRAIYGLDWTFATLYAVHLTPDGRGYKATREEFVAGSGLPLTDAVIGTDGAMYFMTGGRRTESALWRIRYVGTESTAPVPFRSKPLELAKPSSMAAALTSADRVARFEARTVLEQQGTDAVLRELKAAPGEPWRVIGPAIALARVGEAGHVPATIAALAALDWNKLDSHQRINWLRAAGLAFARHGQPDPATRSAVLAKIDAAFPSGDRMLDRELCRLLSYLNAPGIVSRTLNLMDSSGPEEAPDWLELAKRNKGYGSSVEKMIANLPPAQVVHYVYCLRVVPGPWHEDERKRFFTWISKLAGNSGGSSYAGFIGDLRRQTLATCTEEERKMLGNLGEAPIASPFANLPAVKGPGREWTVDEIVKTAGEGLEGRSAQRGNDMFRASLCAACHRFGNEGGSSGPDLSNLAGRFTIRDLADSIVHPGAVISDQYRFDVITRPDGTQVTGRIIESKDEKWIVATNPFDLGQTVEIERGEMSKVSPSEVSPMPPALINRLNAEELKDLLAYLLGKN